MDARNLVDLFQQQAQRLGPAVALRARHLGLYRDLTWADYAERVQAAASALVRAGIEPGDRVGLLAENSVDWLIADLAIMSAGAVNVPPHAPLPARQVHYQLDDAGARWLFVSSAGQLDKIRSLRGELPALRGVVAFDGAGPDALSWRGFLQCGRDALSQTRDELARRAQRLGPDNLATIMYTSGTTGNPKGVMLTHGNLLSNAVASNEAACRCGQSVLFNWLPFSHIYARTVDHYISVVAGAPLCLAESGDTIIRDLLSVQPTHLSCVPRFYEKLLDGLAALPDDDAGKKLRTIFGPRIDWLGSGGAPLPPHVAHAFARHGLLILQGYGLTESSPVITFNRKERYKLESVGQAIPGVEVRIADDGEILTRGPHVMKGYWNDAQATADTIADGWLHTGDLGRLDEDGFLFITGRKKELLVLSSGKKVVPNQVEARILDDPCIDQVVVYGEGRSFLTALVVPNWPNLKRDQNLEGEPAVLCADPKVHETLLTRMQARLEDLAPWERVKKCVLLTEPFSVGNDELTVSLKLRRRVIFERHKAALEALYEKET